MPFRNSVRAGLIGFIAFVGLAISAQSASAQFTLSSETRSLLADAGNNKSDQVNTPGVYSNTLTDSQNGAFGNNGDLIAANASAMQNSSIDTTGFSGTSQVSSSLLLQGTDNAQAHTNVKSSYSVTFTVPVPTDIELNGLLNTSGFGYASASFDGHGAVAGAGTVASDPLTVSETLQPGTSYTLMFYCDSLIGGSAFSASGGLSQGSSDYSFTLTTTPVPEPTVAGLVLFPAVLAGARRRRSLSRFSEFA